jgi:DnaJ-domain-containing protein 1
VFIEAVLGDRGIYIDVREKDTLQRLKNFFSCSFIMGLPTEFVFLNGSVDGISIEDEENSTIQDAYSTLQTQPNASMKEIKANYRKLVKKYHPDRVFMCDAKMISIYTLKFQDIQDAFDLIKRKSA